jgi:hypothetical protein
MAVGPIICEMWRPQFLKTMKASRRLTVFMGSRASIKEYVFYSACGSCSFCSQAILRAQPRSLFHCASAFAMPFTMHGTTSPPPPKRFKPQRVADVDLEDHKWAWLSGVPVKPAPGDVVKGFGWGCDLWMCIDVETHDIAPRKHERGWIPGTFGHERLTVDDSCVRKLRVVQLGWTIGDITSDEPPTTKSRIVRPEGFVVTDEVSEIHDILHKDALENGGSLKLVLEEFLKDVEHLVGAGGRLCAHHFEFDAAIIDTELGRCGVDAEQRRIWQQAVRSGMCTMNPLLTGWCCEPYRRALDNGEYLNRHMACPLAALAWTLVPPCAELRAKEHDAGNDSHVGFLVTKHLHHRVRMTIHEAP